MSTYSNDLKAPRARKKRYDVFSDEAYKKFIKKYPQYAKYTKPQLFKIIKTFNSLFQNILVEERGGIELPESLGRLFIGSFEPAHNERNYNHKVSKEYNKIIYNKNLETDGKVCKIFFTNYYSRYRLKDAKIWRFRACRKLSRFVSKEYRKNWHRYVMVDKASIVSAFYTGRLEDVYIKDYTYEEEFLKTYNEFEI